MTSRLLSAAVVLLAAPVALAAGPGSTPDWATPHAAAPDAPPAAGSRLLADPPNPPDPPDPVPVDGGLTLLALAGAGYAAKKLRARSAA